MQDRMFRLKAEQIINPYLMAEKGIKRTKKAEKRAMSKYRRTLEKREVRTAWKKANAL